MGNYMADGHLGQYPYINPAEQLIIVRSGKNQGQVDSQSWQELAGASCISK